MVFKQMDEIFDPIGDGDLPRIEDGPCQRGEPLSAGLAFSSLESRLLLFSLFDDILAPAAGTGLRLQRVDELDLFSAGTPVFGHIPAAEEIGDHVL